VLIAVEDPLTVGMVLIELDGIARRLVLCPASFPLEHVAEVLDSVRVDAIVSDGTDFERATPTLERYATCAELISWNEDRSLRHETEWILLTSGTTGLPKIVRHTLASLAGAIEGSGSLASGVVWGTFYDICRYGGLQIFLRAILTGGSLVLPNPQESTADLLTQAGAREVTHISGTPSHWRRVLMSPAASKIAPQYIRLSGEIADQSILDNLRSFYPQARVVHAFASTEAGVAFEVRDGLAGFPANLMDQRMNDVDMKVEDGSLRIRSPRTATCYIGQDRTLADADGFIDTGDLVEQRNGRYYFIGRRDGVINVGGLKVHPEEVEAVINQHPLVRMSVVGKKKSPITGEVVRAEVILNTSPPTAIEQAAKLEREILAYCREILPGHKVPVAIRFVDALKVAPTGKMVRQSCGTSS
jgi:acyl-CoA synthetase (AMP-forming)/AMP-acid ligase II